MLNSLLLVKVTVIVYSFPDNARHIAYSRTSLSAFRLTSIVNEFNAFMATMNQKTGGLVFS